MVQRKMKKNNLIHRNNVLVIVKVTGDNNYSKKGTVTKAVSQSFFRINGVQKLASAVISPAKLKTLGAVFTWLFLLLDAEQLFYNLSNKRCSISCPSILAQKTAKYEELFFRLFL